jgi:hypothetical protein
MTSIVVVATTATSGKDRVRNSEIEFAEQSS